MSVAVEVRSKVPGASGPVLPAVLVELESETVTARELIRRAVLEQIATTRVTKEQARAMLDRQYLLPAEIAAMAATGAVKTPGRVVDPDPEAEIARAWKAFERQGFVLLCGDRQVHSLDEQLTVRLGEPVTFLRLVPLVGG
jgi:hypothetical protein